MNCTSSGVGSAVLRVKSVEIVRGISGDVGDVRTGATSGTARSSTAASASAAAASTATSAASPLLERVLVDGFPPRIGVDLVFLRCDALRVALEKRKHFVVTIPRDWHRDIGPIDADCKGEHELREQRQRECEG